MTNRNVPKLRFEEFTDNWNELKLDSLSKKIIAGATPKTSVREYWIDGTIPWMSSGEIHKKKVYSTDKMITQEGYDHASTTMIPINCVLVALAGQGITRGTVAVNKIELCTNQSIASIITNDKLNYKYLFYYLEKNYEKLRSLSNSDGGKGSLNLSILKSLKIKLPTNIKEQIKISSFITKIDEKIEALTNKKDEFIKFKQYLLQNLFPQKDEKTPKLRFNRFADELKSYTLKDLFNSKTGDGLSKGDLADDGQFECILYGELFTTYDEIITTIKSKTDSGDGVLSEYGDILIPISTTTTGSDLVIASVILKDDVKLGSDMTILRKKKKDIIDEIYFAYYFTYILPKEISKYAQGITIVHLAWKYFKNTKITVPSLLEQKTVVNLLINIDNKIDLIEKEIEQVEEYKKGLLQKMFI